MIHKNNTFPGPIISCVGDLCTSVLERFVLNTISNKQKVYDKLPRTRTKQVLVVDDGGLAGIFTEKDLLNRVLSKARNPDHTVVADVMTPNPDTVSSSMTVIEALQEVSRRKEDCREAEEEIIVLFFLFRLFLWGCNYWSVFFAPTSNQVQMRLPLRGV